MHSNLHQYSVNLVYGNIKFALERWQGAMRFYMDALKIALTETPIHFTTSTIYYRLGCVELAMNNHDAAQLVLYSSTLTFLSSS